MNDLKALIYNCRRATFLVDKKLYSKITFKEEIELRIHLIGCDACKLYIKQSQKINMMLIAYFKPPVNQQITLDDAFKERLHLQINDSLKNN